nr:MAG TPA: hypothetical protein [Bacteriophage sp.]
MCIITPFVPDIKSIVTLVYELQLKIVYTHQIDYITYQ